MHNAVRGAVPFVPPVFFAPSVGLHTTGEPIVVPPLANVTLPVGPAPLLFVATVTDNVTLCPEVIEFGLAVTLVIVAALVIVTESVLLVLLL